jgi:anti-anti-sigma factor
MATIYTQSSAAGDTLTIRVEGKFDFVSFGAFRDAYKSETRPGMKYQIDLSKTEAMDSSALGMLLMAKEYAEANRGTVILSRPTPGIKEILEVANFYKLFVIEG